MYKLLEMNRYIIVVILLTNSCLGGEHFNKDRVFNAMNVNVAAAKRMLCDVNSMDFIAMDIDDRVWAYTLKPYMKDGGMYLKPMAYMIKITLLEYNPKSVLYEEALSARKTIDNLPDFTMVNVIRFSRNMNTRVEVSIYQIIDPTHAECNALAWMTTYGERGNDIKNPPYGIFTRISNDCILIPEYFEVGNRVTRFWTLLMKRQNFQVLLYFRATDDSLDSGSLPVHFMFFQNPGGQYKQFIWYKQMIDSFPSDYNVIGLTQRTGLDYLALQHAKDKTSLYFYSVNFDVDWKPVLTDDGTSAKEFFDCEIDPEKIHLLHDLMFTMFIIFSYILCLAISYEEHQRKEVHAGLKRGNWTAVTSTVAPFVPKKFLVVTSSVTWINRRRQQLYNNRTWDRIKKEFLEIFGETDFDVLQRKITGKNT